MKYLYFILIVAILYIVLEGVLFSYRLRKVPELLGFAGSEVLGQGPTLIYVASGDSTAAGLGATSKQNTYTFAIARYLAGNHTVTFTNLGQGGAKISDYIKFQLPKIIKLNPDIVTVSVGANDATRLTSNSQILQNYKTIIDSLSAQTNAKVYITVIPNFSDGKILPYLYRKLLEFKHKPLNRQLMALENERVKIVNIHDFGWDRFENIESTFAPDNFHPNDLGYSNWRDAFLDKIKKDF